ncbi:MAG: RNA-guided pseudouridylation complex pseudouridine synthase subunit Cbf5 [Candidatus Pacearchaeota archaeon]|jgi:H/ACA ribonucleoprotein complex subunit 4
MKQEKPIPELLEFSIINVDKPANMTSFVCADRVRKMVGAKKAGHTGTLDPMVTGVLPVLLNRATRLSNYFMKKDKVYVGKMLVHKDISEQKLKDEMEFFIGKIMQKPPVKSRVKRVLRERTVNKFKIIKKNGRVVEFESDVQAGTYIRKLISDLGEKIGGAHMTELRRIKAGLFKVNESHKLEKIQEAYEEYKNGKEENLRKMLIPAEIVKQLVTSLQVKEESVKMLLNGKPLTKEDIIGKIPNSEQFSVFFKERFIGIYNETDSLLNERGNCVIAKPAFVMN